MLLYLRKAATGKGGDRYVRVKGTQGKVPEGLIRMKNRVTHRGHDGKSINSNITDFLSLAQCFKGVPFSRFQF